MALEVLRIFVQYRRIGFGGGNPVVLRWYRGFVQRTLQLCARVGRSLALPQSPPPFEEFQPSIGLGRGRPRSGLPGKFSRTPEQTCPSCWTTTPITNLPGITDSCWNQSGTDGRESCCDRLYRYPASAYREMTRKSGSCERKSVQWAASAHGTALCFCCGSRFAHPLAAVWIKCR